MINLAILLGRNNSLPQKINKSISALTTISDYHFTKPMNLMETEITLKSTGVSSSGASLEDRLLSGALNYVTLQHEGPTTGLNRHYFITDCSVPTNGIIVITIRLDVLYTYRATIMDMTVVLDRASNSYDEPGHASSSGHKKKMPYIADPMFPITNAETIQDIMFDFEFSGSVSKGTYILLTAQNGYTPVGVG